VVAVVLELSAAGETQRIPLQPGVRESEVAVQAGQGHLAAIQERNLSDAGAWGVWAGPMGTDDQRYRFQAESADGRRHTSRWFRFTPRRWAASSADQLPYRGPAAKRPRNIEWLLEGTTPVAVRFELPLASAERVTGLGERFERQDQRGHSVDAVVYEQYKSQAAWERTYLPMPFAHVISPDGLGWGVRVRTTCRSRWSVDDEVPDALRLTVVIDPEGQLPEVVIDEGTPTQVLSSFLDECGRATELPEWVFGLWASDNEWNTQELVSRQVALHREHDIPVRVVVIEAWSDEATFTAFRDAQAPLSAGGAPLQLADYRFPADGAWPDPAGMVAAFREQGIHTLLWQIPLLKMKPPASGQAAENIRTAREQGYLIREADGRPYRNRGPWFPAALMPDLRDEQARSWWTERLRYLVEEVGIDGFKTDGGEHAWGDDLRYLDGTRSVSRNNTYPSDYQRAYGDLLRSAGKAPLTFSRSGFAGGQPNGVFWAGDEDSSWEALRSSLRAGLNAAACGIVYWTWDLAGFSGPVPDPELYLRATALSTFLPVMQYHAEYNFHRAALRARTPWNVADVHQAPHVIDAFRSWVKLRERLIPYLAASARGAIDTDRPLLRPLYFENWTDPSVWQWEFEFQLGDDLLVHPVTEPGATSWDTYLPAGSWVDVWDGSLLSGGAIHRRPVGDLEIPVYCRRDAWPSVRAVFAAG